jgi:hypothetical protein
LQSRESEQKRRNWVRSWLESRWSFSLSTKFCETLQHQQTQARQMFFFDKELRDEVSDFNKPQNMERRPCSWFHFRRHGRTF